MITNLQKNKKIKFLAAGLLLCLTVLLVLPLAVSVVPSGVSALGQDNFLDAPPAGGDPADPGPQASPSGAQPLSTVSSVIVRLQNIINLILPFLVGLAVLVIIWGIFGYITQAANEEKRKEARQFITWGFLGIFIMLSVWGILNILVTSFNFDRTARPTPTTIPVVSGQVASGQITTLSAVVERASQIINLILPFLVGLAVLFIIYGIFGYITQAANEEKRKEARQFITWGFLGVFIMLSVWGIINILVTTFPTNQQFNYTPPITGTPADPGQVTTIPKLIDKLNIVFATLTPMVFAMATFFVIVGIVGYIRQAGNEEKVKEAKQFIIWGLLSMFIMLSVWGILNIITNTINLDNAIDAGNDLPTLPRVGQTPGPDLPND